VRPSWAWVALRGAKKTKIIMKKNFILSESESDEEDNALPAKINNNGLASSDPVRSSKSENCHGVTRFENLF
jgi:hypothetical protein